MFPNKAVRGGRAEGGSVLVIVMLGLLLMMGFVAAFLPFVTKRVQASRQSKDAATAFYAARTAIVRAATEISTRYDYDVSPPVLRAQGDSTLGSTSFTFAGATVVVNRVDLGSNRYTLTASATKGGVTKRIEEVLAPVIEVQPINIRGAITSNGNVGTLGNISVDGRDWKKDNSAVKGPGTWGISSCGTVTVGGSSTVGGKGIAPLAAVDASGVYEESAYWGNHTNDDEDAGTDEEAWDGLDNDGDGKIDEDVNSYPTNPDVYFGLTTGTLKARAVAAGTYFATEAAFNAYVTAHGGNLPGGGLYYMECDVNPMTFGTALQETPSVIINHTATGSANMKNLHGPFKGLVISDTITHINGDALILGGVMSFAPFTVGNTYGNGAAIVRYSSEVLSDTGLAQLLSSQQIITGYKAVSWRVIP